MDRRHDIIYFFFFEDLRDLPALLNAIAIACLRGLPAFISVLILLDIVFLEEPLLSGMIIYLRIIQLLLYTLGCCLGYNDML